MSLFFPPNCLPKELNVNGLGTIQGCPLTGSVEVDPGADPGLAGDVMHYIYTIISGNVALKLAQDVQTAHITFGYIVLVFPATD